MWAQPWQLTALLCLKKGGNLRNIQGTPWAYPLKEVKGYGQILPYVLLLEVKGYGLVLGYVEVFLETGPLGSPVTIWGFLGRNIQNPRA